MKLTKSCLFIFASLLAVQSRASGQSTWVGAGTTEAPALWSNSLNWTGTVPTNSSTVSLTFLNSAANSVATNDLNGVTVSSISVPANDAAAVPVNIKDNTIRGNPVTLAGNITINTGNWQTFGFGMDLSAVRTFAVNSGQLTLTGDLTGSGGGINKAGGGTLILSGNNSLGAAERLNISSASTVNLDSTSALGAAGGSIRFGNNVAANLSIRSNSAINSYNLIGGSSGTGGTITLGRLTGGAAYTQSFGVAEIGSRTMTFNQGSNISSGRMAASLSELRMTAGNNDRPVTLAGNATITVGAASITSSGIPKRLQLDGTDANNSVTGAITNTTNNTVGAVVSVIKSNSSTWTLGGTNIYTGYTNVNGGTLRLTKRNALYGGATGQWTAANIGVGNSATLALLAGGADEFTASDVNLLLSNLSVASFNGTNNNGLQSGSILLLDTGNAAGGSFTVSQSLTNSTGSTGGPVGLTKAGANTLILAGTNTYTGPTLINGGRLVSDYVSQSVRFAAGTPSSGNGVIELLSNASIGPIDFASGSGNGGWIVLNRAAEGAGLTYSFGSLDLSSVTVTVANGDKITGGNSKADFSELRMSGGNDNFPVTVTGDADITIGSASITLNGLAKRLQLAGSSADNVVSGVISDSATAIPGARVSLIKSGSSTWHLKGNNTYTGDTTINAGTLRLDHPCLNDDSTLSINATLDLTHNQQDTVRSLFVNGTEMPPGIYRSNANPGVGTGLPEITGTGRLQVLTGPIPDPYVSWAQTMITAINPAADATASGDPDGDGVSNLAEFAFKGNPLAASDTGFIRTYVADGSEDPDSVNELILTLAVRKGGADFSGNPLQLTVSGVTYTVQGSLNLSAFTEPVTEVSPITTGLPDLGQDPDYEYRSFSLDGSNGLPAKGFLRAKVEK